MTTIGNGAFADVEMLGEASLPSTLCSIGEAAFFGCDLLDIFFEGTEEQWQKANGEAILWFPQTAAVHFEASHPDCPSAQFFDTPGFFPDSADVRGYAVDAMLWATQTGLINGISSGSVTSLAPQRNATRAQIASIIMRYLEREAG